MLWCQSVDFILVPIKFPNLLQEWPYQNIKPNFSQSQYHVHFYFRFCLWIQWSDFHNILCIDWCMVWAHQVIWYPRAIARGAKSDGAWENIHPSLKITWCSRKHSPQLKNYSLPNTKRFGDMGFFFIISWDCTKFFIQHIFFMLSTNFSLSKFLILDFSWPSLYWIHSHPS